MESLDRKWNYWCAFPEHLLISMQNEMNFLTSFGVKLDLTTALNESIWRYIKVTTKLGIPVHMTDKNIIWRLILWNRYLREKDTAYPCARASSQKTSISIMITKPITGKATKPLFVLFILQLANISTRCGLNENPHNGIKTSVVIDVAKI